MGFKMRFKMKRWINYLLGGCCISLLTSLSFAQTQEASLNRLISQQRLSAEAIGIWVERIGDSAPLATHQPERLFNPASTIKLATTLTNLIALGPDYTWRTEIRATAPIEQGVLRGDLILRGSGDPGAVSEEHWRMLRDLQRSTGLKRIEGDLILDTSYFNLPPGDPGAFDGQPYRAYNQLPHPLLFNANSIRFHILPERGSDKIRIEAEPPLPGMEIVNQLTRGSGSCDAWQRNIRYEVEGTRVIFSGAYPSQCGAYELLRTAVDPEFYAGELFRLHWQQWGGEWNGRVRTHSGPALNAQLLMVHHSRPLSDLIRVANKWSHNVMTRHMALTLGAERLGEPATLEKARVALNDVLSELGVNTSGMFIENGSGLSRSARISPQQMAQILQAGWRSPWRPEFISSLSIAGLDGTTRRQYRQDPKRGQMHLKTGLLNQVSGISGYLRSQCGEDWLVVLLINHPEAHQGLGTQLQQQLLEWVYQQPHREGRCQGLN